MKKLKNILLLIILMISSTVFSQELSIESNLSGLKLKLGEEFTPDSYALDRNGEKIMCAGVIYYNKRGVFSRADAITVDREEGKIIANKPGIHEVVALCVSQDGQRLSRTFDVVVDYPKTEEIKITLGGDKIYADTYVPLNFEVIDEMGYKRDDILFKLNSSNNVLEVDSYNNVKAIKPGSASLEASYDGISAKIKINVLKNPVSKIEISSNIDVARTGDVVEFKAVGYDSRGREVKNLPFEYSFSGKAIDKTTTASGLILDDGRFVAEIIGDYLITTSLGNISASKRLKIIDRGVEREIIKVGKGVVSDKHTSDFWVFEGVDGRDYAGVLMVHLFFGM